MHHTVPPSRWCINRRDLDDFEREVRELYKAGGIPPDPEVPDRFHDDPSIGPSMYRVNECYIKPRTMEAGTSWALMRHPEGLPCDVFVTHCWSEGVFEFIGKVREAWPWDAHRLYICFLSNPQNGDVSALLGENPMESPFAQALCSAKYFLVIPNRRRSLYSRLWCVFEASLALEHGLVIRMPCRPKLSNTLLVLTPRCFLFFGCFGLLWQLADQFRFEQGTHILGLAIALGARALTSKFPRASWAVLALLGMISGLSARVILGDGDNHHEIPALLRVPVVDTCFVILVLTWDSLHMMCERLLRRTLLEEGYQMQFDTVRSATATNASDAQRIRVAIRGKDHVIDQSIQVLKAVGRYDQAVRSNLRHGMSLKSIRTGFQSCLVVGALYCWLLPFCSPLHWEGPDRLSPSNLREILFFAFTAVVVVCDVCLEFAGRGFYKDYGAFVCQVIFLFGLGRHISIGLVTMLALKHGHFLPIGTAVAIQDGGSLNITIFVCCAIGAAAVIARFYCQCSTRAAVRTISEVENFVRLPSLVSTGESGDVEASACEEQDTDSLPTDSDRSRDTD
mmetsp:Transcript_32633/g.82292  ORF Transcript_32633/g.82292 Transcript_32633/m.82292 type:complete len:565 (-) Transcript_32633:380-2074(-)